MPKPKDDPNTVRLTAFVDPETAQAFKRLAAGNERTTSGELRYLIRRALDRAGAEAEGC